MGEETVGGGRPGWWLATDGRWYPPELHPAYRPPANPPPSAAAQTTVWGAPAAPPAGAVGSGPSPYGVPPWTPYGPTAAIPPAAWPDAALAAHPGLTGETLPPGVAVPTIPTGPGGRPPPAARPRGRPGRLVAVVVAVIVVAAGVAYLVASRSPNTPSGSPNTPSASTVPPGHGGSVHASIVSCTSTGRCVGVDTGIQTADLSVDGGTTWSVVTTPLVMQSVSCTSTDSCVAIGTQTVSSTEVFSAETTNGGASWSVGSALVPSAPGSNWHAISCFSPLACVAVGNANANGGPGAVADYTTNGGASWDEGSMPPGVSLLVSVSCPAPERCYAAGADYEDSPSAPVVVSTVDGGSSWSIVTSPGVIFAVTGFPPGAIACSSSRRCLVVGQAGPGEDAAAAVTTDDGQSWSSSAVSLPGLPGLPSSLIAAACPSPTDCLATAEEPVNNVEHGLILYSSDGGSSWSTPSLPSGSGSYSSVSCFAALRCVATGLSGFLFTSDGGQTWQG